MDPMRREHTIGSSMSDNLRPQFARGRAFKNAEAASDETAKIRAFSASFGVLSKRLFLASFGTVVCPKQTEKWDYVATQSPLGMISIFHIQVQNEHSCLVEFHG